MRRTATIFAMALVLGTTTTREASAATQRSGPFTYVTEGTTVRAGTASAEVAAVCPSGTSAIGSGGGFDGRSLEAKLTKALIPDAVSQLSEAQGMNDDVSDRRLTSVAICLRNDVAAVTPLSASVSSTFADSTASGTCAQTLIGGSGGYEPPLSSRDLIESFPQGIDGWRVASRGTAVLHSLFLRASCVPDGEFTTQVVSREKVVAPDEIVRVKVPCPRGTRVTSGGAESGFRILASRPLDSKKDADKTPDDGWLGIVTNQTAVSDGVEAYALCARLA